MSGCIVCMCTCGDINVTFIYSYSNKGRLWNCILSGGDPRCRYSKLQYIYMSGLLSLQVGESTNIRKVGEIVIICSMVTICMMNICVLSVIDPKACILKSLTVSTDISKQ